jgi:hypothetical protein
MSTSSKAMPYCGFNDQELDVLLQKTTSSLEEARQEFVKAQEAWQKVHDRYRALLEEQESRQWERQKETGKIDWAFLMDMGTVESSLKHKVFSQELAALSKVGEFSSLQSNGYFPDTNQRAIKLWMYKDHAVLTEKTAQALEVLLPSIKPLKTDKKWKSNAPENAKIIGIMDRGLSEYASYKMYIDEATNTYDVVANRHGHLTVAHQASNLRDLLQHVEQNFYYEEYIPKTKNKSTRVAISEANTDLDNSNFGL